MTSFPIFNSGNYIKGQVTEDEVNELIDDQKGIPYGIVPLDGNSKIPSKYLDALGLSYQGTWNASTNTPTLVSGVGVQGDYYVVSVTGTTNLDGVTDWTVGDWALFNGTIWQKLDQTDVVISVAGKTGVVTLNNTDISGLTLQNLTAHTLENTILQLAGISNAVVLGVYPVGGGAIKSALYADGGAWFNAVSTATITAIANLNLNPTGSVEIKGIITNAFTNTDVTTLALVDANTVKNNFNSAVDPTVNDDSSLFYANGSIWNNTTLQKYYVCESPAVGSAIWLLLNDVVDLSNYVDKTTIQTITAQKNFATITSPLLILEDVTSGGYQQVKNIAGSAKIVLDGENEKIISGQITIDGKTSNGQITCYEFITPANSMVLNPAVSTTTAKPIVSTANIEAGSMTILGVPVTAGGGGGGVVEIPPINSTIRHVATFGALPPYTYVKLSTPFRTQIILNDIGILTLGGAVVYIYDTILIVAEPTQQLNGIYIVDVNDGITNTTMTRRSVPDNGLYTNYMYQIDTGIEKGSIYKLTNASLINVGSPILFTEATTIAGDDIVVFEKQPARPILYTSSGTVNVSNGLYDIMGVNSTTSHLILRNADGVTKISLNGDEGKIQAYNNAFANTILIDGAGNGGEGSIYMGGIYGRIISGYGLSGAPSLAVGESSNGFYGFTNSFRATVQNSISVEFNAQGIICNNGSLSLPSLTLGDSTTGLYRSGAGQVAITVTGTQRLRISATGAVITGNMYATGACTLGLQSGGINHFINGSLNAFYAETVGNRKFQFYSNTTQTIELDPVGLSCWKVGPSDWIITSDPSMKQILSRIDIEESLTKINNIDFITYKWNSNIDGDGFNSNEIWDGVITTPIDHPTLGHIKGYYEAFGDLPEDIPTREFMIDGVEQTKQLLDSGRLKFHVPNSIKALKARDEAKDILIANQQANIDSLNIQMADILARLSSAGIP